MSILCMLDFLAVPGRQSQKPPNEKRRIADCGYIWNRGGSGIDLTI